MSSLDTMISIKVEHSAPKLYALLFQSSGHKG